MKNNVYNLQAEMDVVAAILAREMGRMAFMMPNVSEGEKKLYEAVEAITLSRIDPHILHDLEKNHVFERAHILLLKSGFSAFGLCQADSSRKR